MRVHLIAPSREENPGTHSRTSIAPPLNLAVLASISPPEVEISLTDENVEPIDCGQAADLVGITATTQTATRAYQVADAFRARGVKVALGGLHPSTLPEEAVQHADAVVVGEAEGVWPHLLSDLRDGRLQRIYRGNGRPQLAGLPIPRRDLFHRKRYLLSDSLYTSRGCPFGCAFCSVTSFFGGTYRWRPVDEVLREISELDGRPLIFFVDDNIAGHKEYARELFLALAARKVGWIGQASTTIARDQGLLALAAASGCRGLFLGIESLSPASLGSVGKRQNVVEEYEEAIRRIHAHNIAIVGSFIFGLDDDTEDVFDLTVRFAQRTRLEAAEFNILMPYPGTPLMARLEREGRILTRDWSQYREDRAVFAPRLMSVRRLEEGRAWAWREFYSLGSIWKRVGLSAPMGLMVWTMNLEHRSDPLSRAVFDRLASWASPFFQDMLEKRPADDQRPSRNS